MQLAFHYSPHGNELTLVTWDRPLLFANIAGALAAWGMNIRDGGCVLEPAWGGGGQLPVYGCVSDAGDECDGAGAVRGERA